MCTAGSLSLVSCAKDESIAQPKVTTGVKIVNGRLAFADQKAFDNVNAQLWQKSSAEMNQWEKSVGFNSLRTRYAQQPNAQQPNAQQPIKSPAAVLMEKFGFPPSYATLINEAGEYQIGDTIFWFHENFKHGVASEEELALVKQNPAISKVKYSAGIVPEKTITGNAITNTGTLSGNSGDTRYYHGFYYKPANQWTTGTYRIIYQTESYAEQRAFGHFFTTLTLKMKLEFEAAGGGWYKPGTADIRGFGWDLTMYSNVRYRDQGRVYVNNRLVRQVINNIDDSWLELGRADVYASSCFTCGPSVSNIQWNYDLYGSIFSTTPRPESGLPPEVYNVTATAPNMLW